MRVVVDRERCVGAGMCVLTAPEVFDQDDEEGRVLLLDASPTTDRQVAARAAVTVCPSGAVAVTG
jgi:ferredoxin